MEPEGWKPITSLSLGRVGTKIDVLDRRRLYSGILLSGIEVVHSIVEERTLGGETNATLGPPACLVLYHTYGEIDFTLGAQWRVHD